MSKKVIFNRKVNFYETDAQGIVHHSNYPRYFEEARGFFLESLGFPYHRVREDLNIDIILLDIHVSYKKPLFYGDFFAIEIELKSMNRFFFSFDYNVLKEREVVSIGTTKHCCIDRSTKKMVSIPEKIRKLLK